MTTVEHQTMRASQAHQAADALLAEEMQRRSPDPTRLHDFKVRKLREKDRLAQLARQSGHQLPPAA